MATSTAAATPTPTFTALDAVRKAGIIIASDGAEYHKIAKYTPTDATTNPSLVYAAVSKPEYAHLVNDAVVYALSRIPRGTVEEKTELALDRLLVQIGFQILTLIPARISLSIDPRLASPSPSSSSSSSSHTSILAKSHSLLRLTDELNIPRHRVLLKIPATHAGIHAAHVLQREQGVRTNATLVFGTVQALACAQAGVRVVSPFVGRVKDWWDARALASASSAAATAAAAGAAAGGGGGGGGGGGDPDPRGGGSESKEKDQAKETQTQTQQPLSDHPGITLVHRIKAAYTRYGYTPHTQIMAAGFRKPEEVIELSRVGKRGGGPDLVTLPPELLEGLMSWDWDLDCAGDLSSSSPSSLDEEEEEEEEDRFTKDLPATPPIYFTPQGPTEESTAAFERDLRAEGIALDKVPEGLAKFSVDAVRLEERVRELVVEMEMEMEEVGGAQMQTQQELELEVKQEVKQELELGSGVPGVQVKNESDLDRAETLRRRVAVN